MDHPSLKLVKIKGPRDGEAEFQFGSTVRIGRVVRGNNMPIKDAGISTKHLVIESLPESKKWVLTDLDSSNGTFLNGVKLSPHVPTGLNDGDVVKLGELTSLMVKIGGVVAEVENAAKLDHDDVRPPRNPTRLGRGKNTQVEVEAANLGQGDGKSKRNPTRRVKAKNPRIDVEVDNSAELELNLQQNPSNQLGVGEPRLEINPNCKIKVEIESEEIPENNEIPQVEVKRGRGRPQKNGGVVERVTRSRSQMSEVESVELGNENEVVQNKTRGGTASRGRGRGRRANSKKEAVDIEIVDNEGDSDMNSKKEAMQVPVVENEGEDDNDRSSKGKAMEIQNDRNADAGSCGNEERGPGRENVRVEEVQSEGCKDNDNVEVFRDSYSEGTDNENVEVIRHSDEKESVAIEKKADGESHGKAEAEDEFDWEKSTVGEWLDYLEVALPKQIREETEKMIDDMRRKAELVKKYMIEQKIKKAKENAK